MGQATRLRPPAEPETQGPSSQNGSSDHEQAESEAKGKFTDEEVSIITLELLKHREMYDLTKSDQNALIQGSASAAEALWSQLYEALPGRPRFAIRRLCRRRFHNFGVRGVWTAEEDEELREVYEKYPKSWKQIGDIVNRHPEDCRDRWRNRLVCGDSINKDKWSEEEELNLRACVEEVVKERFEENGTEFAKVLEDPSSHIHDLWPTVSEMMNHTRSRLQCSRKWKRLVARDNEDDDSARDLNINQKSWRAAAASKQYQQMKLEEKLALLYAIHDSQVLYEGKISWKRLGNEDFRSKWPPSTRKFVWQQMRDCIPNNENMSLQDIVARLIKSVKSGSPLAEAKINRVEKRKRVQSLQQTLMKTEQQKSEKGKQKAAPLSEEYIYDFKREASEDEQPPIKGAKQSFTGQGAEEGKRKAAPVSEEYNHDFKRETSEDKQPLLKKVKISPTGQRVKVPTHHFQAKHSLGSDATSSVVQQQADDNSDLLPATNGTHEGEEVVEESDNVYTTGTSNLHTSHDGEGRERERSIARRWLGYDSDEEVLSSEPGGLEDLSNDDSDSEDSSDNYSDSEGSSSDDSDTEATPAQGNSVREPSVELG